MDRNDEQVLPRAVAFALGKPAVNTTPFIVSSSSTDSATISGREILGVQFLVIRTMKDATRTARRPPAVFTGTGACRSTMDIKTGTTMGVLTARDNHSYDPFRQ